MEERRSFPNIFKRKERNGKECYGTYIYVPYICTQNTNMLYIYIYIYIYIYKQNKIYKYQLL